MKKAFLSYGLIISLALVISACGGGGGGSKQPAPTSNIPSSINASSASLTVSSVIEQSSSSSIDVSSSFSSVDASSSSLTVSSVIEQSSSSSIDVSSSLSSVDAGSSSLAASSLVEQSSSSSSSSSNAPASTHLIIQGNAVANALAGGKIVFTVGSQTFETAIDESLEYSVTLEIPHEDSDKPFVALATGAGANGWIQLAAIYPSVSKLAALAGDGVLDATEYLGVNISPLTSVEYAIVFNKQLPIKTDEEYKYALMQVDAWDKLKQAAYLSRKLTDTDLSPKYETTLQMLLDNNTLGAMIQIHELEGMNFNLELNKIKADASQVQVSAAPVIGRFLLKAKDFTYFLIFDEAGTGAILTSSSPGLNIPAGDFTYRYAPFSWTKAANQVEIILDEPIIYGKTTGFDNNNQGPCADTSTGVTLPLCTANLDGITLSLVAENQVGKAVEARLELNLVDADGNSAWDSEEIYLANLLDASQFYKITEDELIGGEWSTNYHRYVFNADGTASRLDLFKKTETQLQWTLADGQIFIGGETTTILPMYPKGPGFIAMYLLSENLSAVERGAYQQTPLIKQQDVSMELANWIGRWTRGFDNYASSASDFYADGTVRDGFETKFSGFWSVVNNTEMTAIFNVSWHVHFELIAINSGKYYFQRCEGFEGQVPMFCTLESYLIDATFSGTTWWGVWARPLLYNAVTDEYWDFFGYELNLRSQGITQQRMYIKVAPHLLFDASSGRILEMLSSDETSLEVCEYPAFDQCSSGTSFRLERRPEIKINIEGSGSVSYDSQTYSQTASLAARKELTVLAILPDVGYELIAGNISGCGGELNGLDFEIPILESDCEITVKFTTVP